MSEFNSSSVYNVEFLWRRCVGNRGSLAVLQGFSGSGKYWAVPCTPPRCWLLVTLRDSTAWGDCAGNTPKAMPAETQVQTLETWTALGDTSSHRWWHRLKLLMALWWQLVQMLSLSHHSSLNTCYNQLEEKRPHEPHNTSEWKEPYWQKPLREREFCDPLYVF